MTGPAGEPRTREEAIDQAAQIFADWLDSPEGRAAYAAREAAEAAAAQQNTA